MQHRKGFTIIELLIVVIVLSIVATIAVPYLDILNKAVTAEYAISRIDTQARIAIERMARDIRSAQSITTAGSSSLTYMDNSGTAVTFDLSGTNLQRNDTSLASSISAVSFTYYTSSGATTILAGSAKYIKITLTATDNDYSTTFENTVYLRRL